MKLIPLIPPLDPRAHWIEEWSVPFPIGHGYADRFNN